MSVENPDTPPVTVTVIETPAPEVVENPAPEVVVIPPAPVAAGDTVALTDALRRIGDLEGAVNTLRDENRGLYERVGTLSAELGTVQAEAETVEEVLEEPIVEEVVTEIIPPESDADGDGDNTPDEVVEIRSQRKRHFI